MIRTLSLDLETRSSVDLAKCGVYRYCESPDFGILLFGVSVDGKPVAVYDLASGDTVPEEILAALSDDDVTKYAFNAGFERVALSVWATALTAIPHAITSIPLHGAAILCWRRTTVCLSASRRSVRCWASRSRS